MRYLILLFLSIRKLILKYSSVIGNSGKAPFKNQRKTRKINDSSSKEEISKFPT
ncbi:MAG: hypothetical protein N2201_00790 [candidate division WOR-3 bacterium]|nr:hypothetical protein [candidate division WOR-3 bacterium]